MKRRAGELDCETQELHKKSKGDDAKETIKENDPLIEKMAEEEWEAALKAVLAGKSVFVTGAGGTGKTTWTMRALGLLARHYSAEQVAVVAPTGIAAQAIGGQTIHSQFAIAPDAVPAEVEMIKDDEIRVTAKTRAIFRRLHLLVIDEISMVSPALFYWLHRLAQLCRYDARTNPGALERPFGGLQVICIGDFAQLPPIWTRKDMQPTTRYCFQLPLWRDMFHSALGHRLVLTVPRRQTDKETVETLNRMRFGKTTQEDYTQLSERKTIKNVPPPGVEPTKLFPFVRLVDAENEARLAALPGEALQYRLTTTLVSNQAVRPEDKERVIRTTLKNHPVLDVTTLKVGAQVMLMKNINVSHGLANGSRGVVVGFTRGEEAKEEGERKGEKEEEEEKKRKEEEGEGKGEKEEEGEEEKGRRGEEEGAPLSLRDFEDIQKGLGLPQKHVFNDAERLPIVQFVGQRKPIVVTDTVWMTDVLDKKATVVIRGKPLKLAWAITVHKSQGMTIDCLAVGVEGSWEPGHAYVAFSRCVSLDSLQVLSLRPGDIKADPAVVRYYEELKEAVVEA